MQATADTALTLTARDRKALTVLQNGGRMVTGLRRNYFGHEKRCYWFEDAQCQKVNGFGYASYHNLIKAGLVKRDWDVWYGSTCREVWHAL